MGIVFSPTFNGIFPDAAPLATVLPATLMVAPPSAAVGVTVTSVTSLPTLTVYSVVAPAKNGESVPFEIVSAPRLLFMLNTPEPSVLLLTVCGEA